jgi:hypothetical protein
MKTVMAPNARAMVWRADAMDAKSAATPRSSSKQLPMDEKIRRTKSWRRNEAAPIDQRPMARRVQDLPSTPGSRLMNAPLPLIPARSRRTGAAGSRANQRAVSYFRRK